VQSWLVTFRRRLQELGWSDGDNIRIEGRLSGGDADRLRANASELVSLKSDVIYAIGTPVVTALQQATHTIPIVFVNAQNPVGSGFVTSLARPGGNITGFVSFEPSMGGKWRETLKEVAPGLSCRKIQYQDRRRCDHQIACSNIASRGKKDGSRYRHSFSRPHVPRLA
jgi:putative ABC transport system substrate-binding protein